MHDLVIRGGTVVDGTGAPARTSRRGDRRRSGGRGRRARLHARAHGSSTPTGLLVTPGFVDIHTHYDAQIGWDPLATFVLLPRRDLDRDGQLRHDLRPVPPRGPRVPGLVHGVGRGHPGRAPSSTACRGTGRPTASTSAPSTGCPRASTSAAWSATARCAGGPWAIVRSTRATRPTDDELAEMQRLLGEGIDAGALGFSTSRTLRHRVPDGRHVPGTWADDRRAARRSPAVLGAAGRGVVETAPRFDGEGPSAPRARSEIGWMREVSLATGRPVTFNLTHTFENPEHHRLAIELVKAANAAGREHPSADDVTRHRRAVLALEHDAVRPPSVVAAAEGAGARREARSSSATLADAAELEAEGGTRARARTSSPASSSPTAPTGAASTAIPRPRSRRPPPPRACPRPRTSSTWSTAPTAPRSSTGRSSTRASTRWPRCCATTRW